MKKKNLYIASASILIIGLIAAVIFIFQSYGKMGQEMQKFVMPGTAEIVIKNKGIHTFYHEYESELNGDKIDTEGLDLGAYEFTLTEAGSGDEVPLTMLDGSKTYSFGERKGKTLFETDIQYIGTYKLTASKKGSENGSSYVQFVITLDRGFMNQRIVSILGGQLIMIVPALLAFIIFIYAYTKKEEG